MFVRRSLGCLVTLSNLSNSRITTLFSPSKCDNSCGKDADSATHTKQGGVTQHKQNLTFCVKRLSFPQTLHQNVGFFFLLLSHFPTHVPRRNLRVRHSLFLKADDSCEETKTRRHIKLRSICGECLIASLKFFFSI